MKISFIIWGKGRPASFSFGRGQSKTGKPFMYRSVKHAKWMDEIAKQALSHKPDKLMVGAVALTLVFWRRKPKGAGKDWRNAKSPERAAKAAHPVAKPDLTSLERPVEDALKGIMYRDDSQIVSKAVVKVYAADDEPEHVGVCVDELDLAEALAPMEQHRFDIAVVDFWEQKKREGSIPREVTDGSGTH